MNDITALAQRLAALMQEDSIPMSDSWGKLFDALQAGYTENERMARDLMSRNGEIEGLRKRVEELEEISTNYGMKFQRAQDDLKKMALMESRTVTVKLPDDGMDDCYEQWGPEHCRDKFDCGYNFSAMRHMEAFKTACAAAGIQVIEGEKDA